MVDVLYGNRSEPLVMSLFYHKGMRVRLQSLHLCLATHHDVSTYLWFPYHEMTRSNSILSPGWDDSPLKGYPPVFNLPVPLSVKCIFEWVSWSQSSIYSLWLHCANLKVISLSRGLFFKACSSTCFNPLSKIKEVWPAQLRRCFTLLLFKALLSLSLECRGRVGTETGCSVVLGVGGDKWQKPSRCQFFCSKQIWKFYYQKCWVRRPNVVTVTMKWCAWIVKPNKILLYVPCCPWSPPHEYTESDKSLTVFIPDRSISKEFKFISYGVSFFLVKRYVSKDTPKKIANDTVTSSCENEFNSSASQQAMSATVQAMRAI